MTDKEYQKEITGLKKDLASLTDRLETLGNDALEDGQERLESLGNAWDKTKQASQRSKEYVEDHPWPSVALSAALGLMIGLVVGRQQGK